MSKQSGNHPQYPARSKDVHNPIYFTHLIVTKNIVSEENPKGWADPFWDNMTDKQKTKVLCRVPMNSDFESRVFKDIKLDSTYSGPLNPKGLTGMIGRGLLGCYGPNQAADPIVTRFKNGILEMVAIQRSDTGDWAIPGGMVERGDTVSATLRKEFYEEALGNGIPNEEIDQLFSDGKTIYEGWVDDPRNTDWAWMQTVAVHFHIKDDSPLQNIQLKPATDAIGVKWYKLDSLNSLNKLYASHGYFISLLMASKSNDPDVRWKETYFKLLTTYQ